MSFIKERISTNINIKQIVLLILLGLSISLSVNTIFINLDLLQISKINIDDTLVYVIAFIIKILTSCIIGPIIEEILFRGLLYNFISKRLNIILSAILTTLIFGVVHFNITTCIFAFITGLVFIYFYQKTNNLLISFIIHSSCNLLSTFISFIPTNVTVMIISIITTIVLIIVCDKYIKR